MSSVALKEGVEEPWTTKRVVRFIDLLGYREIMLKSDTEPAIVAFRIALPQCAPNGLIENAVMLLRGIIRTTKCHIESRTQEPLNDDSLVMPWLVEHAGCILSRCQKGRDVRTPLERLHCQKPTREFVPFGEKVLARQISTDPMKRVNCRYQYGVWLGMRNNSAECFIGNAGGVFRAREMGRLETQDRWDTEAINSVIGASWRRTDGRWTVDRPEARVHSITIPPLPFEGARIQRERITKQDINEFGATIGCPGCNAIRDNKRAQSYSDRCRKPVEECLRTTPHGAERLDRRNEVIDEALAEEVRREEQWKKRSDRAAAEAPETEPTAAPVSEPREDPIESYPNPKRRLFMKSASLTASGSGQEREWKAIPDDESGMQVEDKPEIDNEERAEPPEVSSTNIRRRIAMKSEPRAVTTREAVDGYREKATRIESV